jgi:hypothetical protein
MLKTASEYVCEPRDAQQEQWLASELRNMPEPERSQFLADWLSPQHRSAPGFMAGFDLLKRINLRNGKALQDLLRKGLEHADVSDVRWWLKSFTPILGAPAVARLLVALADDHPGAVKAAAYWLLDVPEYKERPDLVRMVRDAIS